MTAMNAQIAPSSGFDTDPAQTKPLNAIAQPPSIAPAAAAVDASSHNAPPRAGGWRFTSSTNLDDIRLLGLNAQLGDPMAVAPYVVHVAIAPSMTQLHERLFFECEYRIEVKSSDETTAATIDVRYLAAYTLPTVDDLDPADVVAFGDVTVLRAIHPYLRELVQSVGSRFGLGNLLLGLFRVPVPPPTVEAAKVPSKPKAKRATPSAKRPN